MNKDQYKIYHETKTHTPDDFPYNTYLCSIPLDFNSVISRSIAFNKSE